MIIPSIDSMQIIIIIITLSETVFENVSWHNFPGRQFDYIYNKNLESVHTIWPRNSIARNLCQGRAERPSEGYAWQVCKNKTLETI